MKVLFSIVSVFLFVSFTVVKWDPDAGYIPPYTHQAIIYGSSGSGFSNIIDNNPDTFWESSAPKPDNYISRTDLNLFLDRNAFNITSSSNKRFAFDGNAATKTKVFDGKIEIKFKKPEKLKLLSLKLNVTSEVKIIIVSISDTVVYNYLPSENYKLKSIQFENKSVRSLSLISDGVFEVYEVAGMTVNPTEFVIFEFNDEIKVGWIGSKAYNGYGVLSISVYTSVDSESWRKVGVLNPLATTFTVQSILPEIKAKYLKIEFELQHNDYQKAILQEFEVYDRYGPFGTPEPAVMSKKTFSESFGINAIWGWGYGISSENLGVDKGAQRFNKVAKLVRNYHSLDWDIKKPGQNPNYDLMETGKGTSALDWVNWQSEYGLWKKAGFNIDVCLMFNNQYFPDSLWKNPASESAQYADYFGEYFINKHHLVSVVEIGNEPWEYSKKTYREILAGMSAKFSNLSKQLIVLPCAVQVWDKKNELGNYVTSYLTRKNARHIDGLVTHLYSYVHDITGDRIAVNPEDPRSEVWSVNNLMQFSKVNLSSLPLYVTEFGYDSDGGGDDCTHSNCVSEYEQALYGTRMSLILYRLGVEKFYWYYYANVDGGSIMHNRSGLVSSYSKGMVSKEAFRAFKKLQEEIGDLYFQGVISESAESYIYKFGDKTGNLKALIAWLPTATDHEQGKWIEFPLRKQVLEAKRLVDTKNKEPVYVKTIDGLKVFLDGNPVVVHLR